VIICIFWKGGISESAESHAILDPTIVTIKDRLSIFRADERERILMVRGFIKSMNYCSITNLKNAVVKGIIVNLPFTIADVDNYVYCFKQEEEEVKGKMRWKKSKNAIIVPVELDIIHRIMQSRISMYGDILFIGGHPFLLTISKPIDLMQVSELANKSADILKIAMNSHCLFLLSKNFRFNKFFFDREAGAACSITRNFLLSSGVQTELCDAGTHQGTIERGNQTFKNRFRSTLHSLPFEVRDRRIRKYLAFSCVRSINLMPNSNLLMGLSPREVVTGTKADYKKLSQVYFGAYAHIYSNPKHGNSVHISRSYRAICLGISDNIKSSPIWLNIDTNREVISSNYTIMPIPQSAINLINNLGSDAPLQQTFDDYDEGEVPDTDPYNFIDPSLIPPEPEPEPEDSSSENESISDIDDPSSSDDDDDYKSTIEDTNEAIHEEQTDTIQLGDLPHPANDELLESGTEVDHSTSIPPQPNIPFASTQRDEPYHRQYRHNNPIPTHNRNTRANARSSNFINSSNKCSTYTATNMKQFGYQMSYEKGIKTRPEATTAAAEDEIIQLINLDIGDGVFEWTLTPEQLKEVLRTFLFLKDKYDPAGSFTKFKARLVGDGRGQNRLKLNEVYGSTSSPTALPTSIMLGLGIAASRNMTIQVGDVAGAFLRSSLDDDCYIRLSKSMTDIWIRHKPSDAQYVTSNGELILKLKKGLYGLVQSPLLWYKDASNFLQSIGFKPSSKDPCFYTKWDDDKLTIIIAYVDDFMILSDEKSLGDKYGDILEEHYTNMTRDKGPNLSYVGMSIEQSNDYYYLSMFGFIDEILSVMPRTRAASTPAGTNLFHISGGPLLSASKSKLFYSVVYMLLYLAKRTRPDILLAVQFLTTRVTKSTEEDFEKLQRVINYLSDTSKMKMRLKCGNIIDLICYVDASFAVHDDFKSHTGTIITIHDIISIFIKCSKQGLSTKASTESELVAVSDSLPQIIYTKEFLEEILNKPIATTLLQDNTSTIRLIEAGRALSETTRHINIKFFYVHEYVTNGTMTVQHCKSENMRADGFTKPLQGQAFIDFRNYVLGYHDS